MTPTNLLPSKKPTEVTREELYEAVWNEPVTALAKRYEVTDSYLNRVLKALHIPAPKRGQREQMKVGRQVEKPPLLPAPDGVPTTWAKSLSLSARHAREASAMPPAPTPSSANVERQTSQGSAALANPMQPPAAAELRVVSGGDGPPEEASVSQPEAPRKHPLLKGMLQRWKPSSAAAGRRLAPLGETVDVHATGDSLATALELADELFAAMERKGHLVVLAPVGVGALHRPNLSLEEGELASNAGQLDWRPDRLTVAFVNGVLLGITVFELFEARDGRERPSGCLALHVYSTSRLAGWQRVWREAQPGELVGRLNSIVAEVVMASTLVRERLAADDATAVALQDARVERAQRAKAQARSPVPDEIPPSRAQVSPVDELRAAISDWEEFRRSSDFFEAAEYAADALPAKERDALRERIEAGRAAIVMPSPIAFLRGWTPAGGRAQDADPTGKMSASARSFKFQDPDHPENAWSGRGPTPKWLKVHEAAGRPRSDFLAKKASFAETPSEGGLEPASDAAGVPTDGTSAPAVPATPAGDCSGAVGSNT